jgi:hypothetical protein
LNIFFARSAGGTCGVPPEAALKILIPFGDLERPDKLGHCIQVARLAGHQNFSEQIYMPNVNLRPLKAGPASPAVQREKIIFFLHTDWVDVDRD